ncbi:hypothetical protein [Sulfurospirillum arcachonense]|uniref:hypothetical protein n=1 Tax=Sulfurospirillum arcachonense TaxID=57666 RepID=UPI00046AA09E|nr:hypothetical protein [Sulfurospirillum arcachonense]
MNNLNPNLCPFCECKQLYIVSKTSFKCAKCKKKYSFSKLEKDYEIMNYFCNDISAKQCADALHVNYKSVKDRYMDFRKLILLHVEEVYAKNLNSFSEYEEYYFLPKNKRGKVKYLFDSIGILGKVYNNSIYTILLPDQFSHLRNDNLYNTDVNFTYMKEYAQYLNRHKLIHYEKFDSQILRFWVYLEKKLLHFKGISRENFVYYLKEYEFKFNNTQKEQKNTLWKLWINIKR